jgi:hypothetical protein
MTPEKLEELEKLEAAATPGEWRHLMLRADVRDLFASLREAWAEGTRLRAEVVVLEAEIRRTQDNKRSEELLTKAERILRGEP